MTKPFSTFQIALLIGSGFLALCLCGAALVLTLLKDSQAYKLGWAAVSSDKRVQLAYGSELRSGLLVSGSISVTGPSGDAQISFSIKGTKSVGTAYVEAEKSLGEWRLVALETEDRATGERLVIISPLP